MNALDNRPLCLGIYHDSLIIGGGFWTINGDSMINIAKWGGGSYVDSCGYFYLGVNDPATPSLTVSVFPNPVTETATFQFSGLTGKAVIHLYDAIGREVWSEGVRGSQ